MERYPDDPRGESCLLLGYTPEDIPIHVVCDKRASGHLILVTIYVPTMPKWKDPSTRNARNKQKRRNKIWKKNIVIVFIVVEK